MKELSNSGNSAQWDNHLLDSLSYIKKNLRYPPRRSTYMPVMMWSVFITLLISLVAASIYQKVSDRDKIPMINIVMAFSLIMLFVGNIARYLQSLKFISLPTGLYLNDNRLILEGFLKSQHLLTFRHPDAPEVFQILSRNISAGKEDREVIIFIADDKRILLNSHFTNAGWGFSPQRNHHKMAKMLLSYLRSQAATTQLVHKI